MSTPAELEVIKARHKRRVERRAKYLATLSPKQRFARDRYIAWTRSWRAEYRILVKLISANKKFIRSSGHNNIYVLKGAMKRLEEQRFKARTLMFARTAAKREYQELEAKSQ